MLVPFLVRFNLKQCKVFSILNSELVAESCLHKTRSSYDPPPPPSSISRLDKIYFVNPIKRPVEEFLKGDQISLFPFSGTFSIPT